MVLVNGLIQIKQPMKGIGLVQKNMDKELRFGPMDIFIKVNLKIVSGADKEF